MNAHADSIPDEDFSLQDGFYGMLGRLWVPVLFLGFVLLMIPFFLKLEAVYWLPGPITLCLSVLMYGVSEVGRERMIRRASSIGSGTFVPAKPNLEVERGHRLAGEEAILAFWRDRLRKSRAQPLIVS